MSILKKRIVPPHESWRRAEWKVKHLDELEILLLLTKTPTSYLDGLLKRVRAIP